MDKTALGNGLMYGISECPFCAFTHENDIYVRIYILRDIQLKPTVITLPQAIHPTLLWVTAAYVYPLGTTARQELLKSSHTVREPFDFRFARPLRRHLWTLPKARVAFDVLYRFNRLCGKKTSNELLPESDNGEKLWKKSHNVG